jgi:hypothetical protein
MAGLPVCLIGTLQTLPGPATVPGLLLRGLRPLTKRESAEVSMGSDSVTLNRGRH